MSASVTNDKLTQSMNGGNPVATTVSSARSIGGTSLSCVSLTNWPTATAVYFVTYQKKTDGTVDTTTLCSWKGVVSGTTIGSLTLENGTDAGNAQGDYVEMGPTAAWAQGIYDFGTKIHNTDGSLKDGSVGVGKLATGAVTTDTLAESAVTSTKIDFTTPIYGKLGYAQITSTFGTASSTFVQVTGLTVTVSVPASRSVKITAFASGLYGPTSGTRGVMSIWDGTVGSGTQLSEGWGAGSGTASANGGTAVAVVSPTTGSHTYNVGMRVETSGTASINASTTAPAFILVELI